MKDWNGNRKSVYVMNGDSSHSKTERSQYDYYATAPQAVNGGRSSSKTRPAKSMYSQSA